VVVHSIDRLARNLDDLHKIVKDLTDEGVTIEFLKEPDGIAPGSYALSVMTPVSAILAYPNDFPRRS